MSNATTDNRAPAADEVAQLPGFNAGARAEVAHLYVHIPFCARICPYCAFYKERTDAAQTERFCHALLLELEQHLQNLALLPRTIFFGGGTPTALSTGQLDLLLSGMRQRLDLSALAEWTVEANPGSVSPRKAALLRAKGVSRISLGVQSWNDELLRLLGREHNAAQAADSFHVLRDAGFENISLDLMFGLPGQSLADWEATLRRTIALQPQHISAYCLTYEEDTEFLRRLTRGEYRQDIEVDAQFFETAMQLLAESGYDHYETSNYARAGFQSAHNRSYWLGEDYLGIGPSAFSTIGLERRQNICDYRRYTDRLFAGQTALETIEPLTPKMKRSEQIALLLRTSEGVPAEWLSAAPDERDEFITLDLLREETGHFVLTPKGKLLADSIAAAFVG